MSTNDQTTKPPNIASVMKPDLVFAFIGSVNAGKSTLTGVITKGVVDDGAGAARKLILRHPHEQVRGQTSSITQNHMVLEDGRTVTIVDLAGHQKYLKTTMRGLNGYHIDYSVVLISAKQGFTGMTKEHIRAARSLGHPTIIILTKMDIAPEHTYKYTVKQLRDIIKDREYTAGQNMVYRLDSIEKVEKTLPLFILPNTRIMPVIEISNTTGLNIDVLKKFFLSLPSRHDWEATSTDPPSFTIFEKFKKSNIGTIYYGRVTAGTISTGDKLLIGPHFGKWIPLLVKTIHANDRTSISTLHTGKLGCLSVKLLTDKDTVTKFNPKRGSIITGHDDPTAYWYFLANVYVVKTDRTTIKPNYQPMINCRTVSQVAKVVHSYKYRLGSFVPPVIDEPMRGGDRAQILFKFINRPEHLHEKDTFIIRENDTRGIAVIEKLMTRKEANIYHDEMLELIPVVSTAPRVPTAPIEATTLTEAIK